MSSRLFAMAGLIAAIGAPTQPSSAQRPESFSLNWVRDANAESCIDSHRLAALIERMLGPVFVVPADAELAIEGRVFRAEQWHARIAISDRTGKLLGARELSSATDGCRALDPQIVLVVAMAIDPEIAAVGLPPELLAEFESHGDSAEELLAELRAETRRASPAPSTKPPPHPMQGPATTTKAGQSQTEPLKPPSRLEEFGAALLADFGLGLGLLPELGTGVGVGVTLQPSSPWTIAVALQWWLANHAAIEGPVEASVAFHLVQGSLVGCFDTVRTRALRWSGCLGVSMGARWTDVDAIAQMSNEIRFEFGPSLTTELWFAPIGPVIPRLGLALRAPLQRDRYTYRDGLSGTDRELFRPAAIEGWAYLGGALVL